MTDDLRPADPTPSTRPGREPSSADEQPSEPSSADPPAPAAPGPSHAPVAPATAPVAAVPPAQRRSRAPIFGYFVAGIVGIAIGAIALALASGGEAAAPSPSPVASATAAPSETANVDGRTVGRADAPVTIEVWGDYQCSFCRLEDQLFGGALEREYVMPGLVRIVQRDFAFLGPESIGAAVAGRCAGRQEPAAQRRYHDALYTFQQGVNQGRFGRANLVQVAEIAGVPDGAAFAACLDDPAVLAEVQAETAVGRSLGIDSTPTLRLSGPGGEQVRRGFNQTWPTLRDAIEAVRVPGGGPSPTPVASPVASPSPSP